MAQADIAKQNSPIPNDVDPAETAEWLESLDYVLERKGPERVQQLLTALEQAAIRNGVELPFTATTPYVNTIPHDKEPRYPGKRELERRIKSFVRWNTMAIKSISRGTRRLACTLARSSKAGSPRKTWLTSAANFRKGADYRRIRIL